MNHITDHPAMTIGLNSVAAGMVGGPKFLALPRPVVSFPLSNYYDQHHNHNNNNNYIRFCSRLSIIRSPITRNQFSYRSSYTYNDNISIRRRTKSSSSRLCSCNYDDNINNNNKNSSNCQNSSPSIQINIVFPSASAIGGMLAHVYSKVYPLLDELMLFVKDKRLFFLQVAVSDKERALRRKLNKISENANTSTSDGLNYVFKEVIKALLQYNDSSIHFTKLAIYGGFCMSLTKEYEDFLSRELESHGKEENTFVNIDDNVKYKNEGSMVKANSSIENEYTVVTLLVLATGQYMIPYLKGTGARYNEQKRGDPERCCDFFEVLRTLERIPKNELHSVEVLWSPRKEDKVLLEDELVRDFPRLIRIENGLIYGDEKE